MSEPANVYHVRAENGRDYPADLATLQRWVREARVGRSTPVWSAADNAWKQASLRAELKEAFADQRNPQAPPIIGPPTNSMAIWSFVLSQFGLCCCFSGIPAIICGFVALNQIRQRSERGRPLAISGIILGFMGLLLGMLLLLYTWFIISLGASGQQEMLNNLLHLKQA